MKTAAATLATIAQKRGRAYAVKSISEALHIKDVDLSRRIVTGFYNTYNYFDSDYDVILNGAASKSIAEKGPLSTATAKIKHLMFHDWCLLPGKIEVLKEDTADVNGQNVSGIYFETKMSNNTLGNDTLISYQEGIYDNHSIGFQFLDGEYIDDEAEGWDKAVAQLLNPDDATEAGFMFLWKEIRLYEGSTVAFGANDLTPYLGVKNLDNQDAVLMKLQGRIDILTKQVRSGKQSDEALQSLDMQLLQLNQIVTELFTAEPSLKATLAKGRQQRDTGKEELVAFDMAKAIRDTQFIHI